MAPSTILLYLFIAFIVIPVVSILALIYLPKPAPDRWEVRLFLLMGMPADQFLAFMVKNGVDPVFYHRALYATYISLMNMLFWIPPEEEQFPTHVIEATEIKQAPIFILGHFRSGTSMLHELISKDERLVAPNAFQCYTPRIFLGREEFMSKRFSSMKIERPMDNMKVGFDSSFEDEFALANLSGLSPYMGAIFPRQYHYYERFLTLQKCTADELAAWKRTILYFFKKVLFRRPDKRLILKSPSHTARVKVLNDLFPGAKFIHISRNPYEIYQSTHKLHDKLLVQWCLQRPPFEDKNWKKNNILNHFRLMYDAYFQDITELKREQLMDIRYVDLINSPTNVIEEIYQELQLGDFEKVRPQLEAYEAEQKAYKPNKHTGITEEEKAEVQQCWGDYFDYYGYEK